MAIDINLNNVQVKPIVVNADLTAVLDRTYNVVASAIFTDPTPIEGKGFIVFVRNGTATVGGVGYSTAGTVIRRIYHSGAWANYTGTSVDVNTIGAAINGATSATPNDTDLVMSVDTSVAKKNTWTQIKAFLKTYFDTVYQAAGTYLTSANITQTITNGVTDKAPSEDAVYDALALKQNTLTNPVTGTGTSNEIAYWSASNAIGSLAVATYPSLTELSYVKGLTSAIQTQLDNKVSYTMGAITSNLSSPADSTTYYTYLGGGAGLLIAAQVGIQFAKTGTINIFQITGFHSTNASNESVSFYLRNITTATDYKITTSWDDSYGANTSITRTYTGLNIPISNTTDKWILKVVTPSWGTNPTNWQFIFSYIIEF